MNTIQEIFDFVKFKPFLEKYTDINPDGGIRHRKTGNGTNQASKNKEFTEDDRKVLKAGLQKLVKDINKIIDKV